MREFKNLYAMSLVNRKAVADQLLLDSSNEILILGSGWEGAYSLEDSLAAGALASYLLNSTNQSVQVVNDELNSAIALWSYWKTDLIGCLRKSTHGQRLQRLGNHDEDFLCCSELDNISTVPIQREKGILFSL